MFSSQSAISPICGNLGRLFLVALHAGATPAIRAFIARGADLAARDSSGRTPLIIVTVKGHLESARVLLQAGADPASVDDEGLDAVAHAERAARPEMVALLNAARAEPEAEADEFCPDAAKAWQDEPGIVDRALTPAEMGDCDRAGTDVAGPVPAALVDQDILVAAASDMMAPADPQLICATAPIESSSLSNLEGGSEASTSNKLKAFPREFQPVEALEPDPFADWVVDELPSRPEQRTDILKQVELLQNNLSLFHGDAGGEQWDEVDLILPPVTRRQSAANDGAAVRSRARKLLAQAFDLGVLSVDGLAAGQMRAVLASVAGDAGLVLAAEDFWISVLQAGPVEIPELDELVDEVVWRLSCIDAPSPFDEVVEKLPRLERHQEEALFSAMDQAWDEAALQLAKSESALRFVIATDALIERAELEFSFVSRLEVEDVVRSRDPEVDDRYVVAEGVASGYLLPSQYESSMLVVREVHELMSAGRAGSADMRRCARALRDCTFSLEYLSYVAVELNTAGTEAQLHDTLLATCARVRELRQQLFIRHLPHVRHLAQRFARAGLEVDDLVQEGSIGLLRSVELFDPSRGNRFWTYAIWMVRQAMGRASDDKALAVRIPVHVRAKLREAVRVRHQKVLETGYEPAPELLATTLGLSLSLARFLSRVDEEWFEGIWLSPQLSDELERSGTDPHADPHQYRQALDAELGVLLRSSLMSLDARAERVIRLRFGFGALDEHTLEEVGKQFDVTRERIRQIEAKALRKLGHPARGRDLRNIWDHHR